MTNPFLHEWNPVHEAFDHYDASFIGNQGPTRGHPELVWTERMYADSVNAAIRAYYDGRPAGEAEFLYVHYIDVHGRKSGEGRWAQAPFSGSYEAATRFVDGKVRELYDYFLARSAGQLIFVVTSDHGQEAEGGDDELVGDGPPWRQRKASLHDFNLRIPCYVLPSQRVAARVIDQPCSNADVTPTLLDWLGLEPHAGAAGQSLLAALRGEAYEGSTRVLYACNTAFGRREDCIVHGGRKYMRYELVAHQPVSARRLFDLREDPAETRSLAPDANDEAQLLEAATDRGHAFAARFEEPSAETREQLQKLGYGGEDEGK